jgi:hypothetical protein
MKYDFLIDAYETERVKVVSAWSMFTDQDLPARPHPTDTRGRSFHEHRVHQCVSEDSGIGRIGLSRASSDVGS